MLCRECPNVRNCMDDDYYGEDFECPNYYRAKPGDMIPTVEKDRARRALRRKTEYRKKKQRKETLGYVYNPYAGWIAEKGYIHESSRSGGPRYYKRLSNRIVRRREQVANGNQYRKHFEYWYTLF